MSDPVLIYAPGMTVDVQYTPVVVQTPPPPASSLSEVTALGWNEVIPASFAGIDHGERGLGTIQFTNSMPWNPIRNGIWIVGQDHGDFPPWHSEYVDNTFVAHSRGMGSHGYQHSAVNPHTGDIYLLSCDGSGPLTFPGTDVNGNAINYTMGAGGIYKYDWATHDYVRVADTPESSFASGYFNLPIGCSLTWWDGPIQGGGPNGALVLYSGQGGGIYVANPETWQWSGQFAFPHQLGYYHVVSAYSKTHNCMVFGGGNHYNEDTLPPDAAVLRKLYRFNADLTVTPMPDAPWRFGVYNGANLVGDSRSGNILLLGKGDEWPIQARDDHPEHWSLNPSGAGAWTRLPDPPSYVLNPSKGLPIISSDTPYGPVYIQTISRQWRMSLWRS